MSDGVARWRGWWIGALIFCGLAVAAYFTVDARGITNCVSGIAE